MTIKRSLAQAKKRLVLGYWQEAIDLLVEASNDSVSEEDRAQIELELGRLYLSLRQPDRALPHLSHTVQMLPDNIQAHYALGLAHVALEQWDKASDALEQADLLAADDPLILSQWGWALFQSGQKHKGKEILNRALRFNLMHVEALLDLAMIYAAEHNFPAAISCAQRAYQFAPDSAVAGDMLSTLYALKQQQEEQAGKTRKDRLPITEQEWRERLSICVKITSTF